MSSTGPIVTLSPRDYDAVLFDMRYAQTMTFTTIVFFDEQSAFVGMFSNKWLWAAVLLSLVLQAAVIYIPFLQQAFSTAALSSTDWLKCAAVGSSVLWLSEGVKLLARARRPRAPD